MVLNIAHRGGAGLAPENTLSCFYEGIKFADMIEFDIQPSKDRQLMVFHDRDNIERTTNGSGILSELSFDYLRSLDAGSWFNSCFQEERIPTLTEVLSMIPSSIQLNIELKYFNKKDNWFETEVLKTIHNFNTCHSSVIAARHVENITRLQDLDSSFDCVLLQKERDKDTYLKLINDLHLRTAQIRKSALDSSFIQNCHDQGIRVFYFYADEPNHMKEALDFGIDGLLTNFPDRLENVIREKREF
jgi:glycerophosphoryl diester phosphodiesterase